VVEVESLEQLDALLAAGATSMRGWRLQDLDLTGYDEALGRLDPAGVVLLGCVLSPRAEASLRERGALLFPGVPDVPFDAYRTRLYTSDELYAGLEDGYDHTLDARIYAWSRTAPATRDIAHTLARSLHDHAIDDALEEYVAGKRLVGVMGGHGLRRGTTGYAAAARLGRGLAATGVVVATGGGPGAMEAANLGAHLGPHDGDVLDEALDRLAAAPDVDGVTRWARAARDVLDDLPDVEVDTLGIPTWFYGHEPPNLFATSIAKFFGNAVREDVLLHVCTAGTVFLPGAAGTVQEVFQDACENYYAPEGARAPMVLVGRAYWTEHYPAWPLLQRLAEEAGFEDDVRLVDGDDEAVELLSRP
jgi:predicted Rossmann-fold nucleotide-binding protein